MAPSLRPSTRAAHEATRVSLCRELCRVLCRVLPALLLVTLPAVLPAAQASHAFRFPGEPPLPLSTSSRASAAPLRIPLQGGLLHTSGFFLNATVGNQQFTLQLDTKYSSLIVPSQPCTGCRLGDRRYNHTHSKHAHPIGCGDPQCRFPLDKQCSVTNCFNCNPSGRCCVQDADTCAFNVQYGDGSSGNGTLFRDRLQLSHLSADVLFGAMHQESHNFEVPYADGVFGLGFQRGACHPICIPPLMDALVNHSKIQNVFTVCVTPFGGTLVLGAADKSLGQGPYHYVDIMEEARDSYFVTSAMQTWKIGDRDLSLPGITSAFWTTATSDIVVSKYAFRSILEHLSNHYCNIPGLCSMESWFRPAKCSLLPDDVVSAMPNFTIGLSNRVSITLTPEDYLLPYRKVNGMQARCVAFVASDGMESSGIGMMLGTAVMRRYAVVHDREQRRIGVAPAVVSECGPAEGTEDGLPALPGIGGGDDVLTADSPKAHLPPGEGGSQQETLLNRETCRAQRSCWDCSKFGGNCSFGYADGKCVPIEDAGKRPYPFCSGVFCACFAVGTSGWYLGIFVGVGITAVLVGCVLLVMRKRRSSNRYEAVERFEEQDLETF